MKGGCLETLAVARSNEYTTSLSARVLPCDHSTPLALTRSINTQTIEYLQTLLRVGDAARGKPANADGVVIVEQDAADAAHGEVARGCQPGKAAADDDDGIAAAFADG